MSNRTLHNTPVDGFLVVAFQRLVAAGKAPVKEQFRHDSSHKHGMTKAIRKKAYLEPMKGLLVL